MSGRRPPTALRPAELERELQAALLHWHDDAWLAQSPLLRSTVVAGAAEPGPAALRTVLCQALARAQAAAGPEQASAYRALELGYLTRGVTHERAAERLSVSRTTFYRLLKRGVQGLARALNDC
jgi:DNA-directed RNA polymerase specialized sigma24 family protein